ncbi:MAG TPA: hypothetical protein VFS08_01600 [Gemmatimonadaceae bacterium]|nr:hypothetical protein [Gemmatimonadaceae bacterium]
MADRIERNDPSRERMGRGVHEGMNAGVSRNAHTTGERQALENDAAYGLDRSAAAPAPAPVTSRPRSQYAVGDPDVAADCVDFETRAGAVGHQAPSGLEEIEEREHPH